MFEPGEKILTISGNTGWVDSRSHFVGYVTYNIWDGVDKYQSMDEWMIKKYEEKKVGFSDSVITDKDEQAT